MEWFDAKYPNGSGEYQDILNGLAEDDRPNDAEWLMDRAGADDSLIEVDSIEQRKALLRLGRWLSKLALWLLVSSRWRGHQGWLGYQELARASRLARHRRRRGTGGRLGHQGRPGHQGLARASRPASTRPACIKAGPALHAGQHRYRLKYRWGRRGIRLTKYRCRRGHRGARTGAWVGHQGRLGHEAGWGIKAGEARKRLWHRWRGHQGWLGIKAGWGIDAGCASALAAASRLAWHRALPGHQGWLGIEAGFGWAILLASASILQLVCFAKVTARIKPGKPVWGQFGLIIRTEGGCVMGHADIQCQSPQNAFLRVADAKQQLF